MAMRDPQDPRAWRLDGQGPAGAMQVASRLASLEPLDGLSYRAVPLEAVVVDVTPCRRTAADVFYRFFRLRPLSPAALGAPCPEGPPDEWTSEAISIPRRPRSHMESKLSDFEAEFAVYTFLQRVERDIDDRVQRVQRFPGATHRGARARSADDGAAYG